MVTGEITDSFKRARADAVHMTHVPPQNGNREATAIGGSSPVTGIGKSSSTSHTWPLRAAGLAGRAHGEEQAPGAPFVFLHGLTFDSRMWDPVLDALPFGHRAIALDLPGHGDSAALPQHGLAVVVETVHEAVLDAALAAPILIGHSIGGQVATLYAGRHPASAVVSVEVPVRLEQFAQLLRSLHPELVGDGFAEAWAIYQDSWHMELLADSDRALLRSGDRPGDDVLRQLVLSYQSELLEQPVEETVRLRDEGLSKLGAAGTPYLTLHSCPVDRADRRWLHELLPQAEILVWPVGHHFPHLAHPVSFAALLTGLAAGRVQTTPPNPR
jgi:pimeloyl-ACP methyl ester carboxylesterase